MTAQTKIGGVNREALLRLWFLFFVWAGVGDAFMRYQPGRWLAWLLGAGLTCLLIYRRSVFAGIAGYLVAATATVMTVPISVSIWTMFLSGNFTDPAGSRFTPVILSWFFAYATLAFVPTAILVIHVASRHRLQRSFEDSVAPRRHGRIVPPGAYYFVTLR